MKTKYLINKGYYIKDDLTSLLLYFDYFSQGLSLPKQLGDPLIRKLLHFVLRIFIIVLYITKLYTLLYKTTYLKENATIIIKGRGSWGSTIKLIKKKDKFKIIKILQNKNLYEKEKKFYNIYKNKSTRIKLPKSRFLKGNVIEMEFLKLKSFQRLTIDGTLSFNQTIFHYNKLCEELISFYGNKRTVIHGDLFLPNIYIGNSIYYLIDFTESQQDTYHYDLYVLLFSILSSYNLISFNEKTIKRFHLDGKSIYKSLNIDYEKLLAIENKFMNYRKIRFPGVYYN